MVFEVGKSGLIRRFYMPPDIESLDFIRRFFFRVCLFGLHSFVLSRLNSGMNRRMLWDHPMETNVHELKQLPTPSGVNCQSQKFINAVRSSHSAVLFHGNSGENCIKDNPETSPPEERERVHLPRKI